MKHTKSYRPSYPRIMFSRNNFYNLNGEWKFKFLDDNFDIYNGFDLVKNFDSELKIEVPYAYQTKDSGINVEKHYLKFAYQRIFEIEDIEDFDYILNFESVDYEAAVYINEVYVGYHIGGYTRFSFNIKPFIKKGSNVITVIIKDGLESDKPRGKQTWMEGPFGCWYKATSGIWKTVWLETISHTRLDSVVVRPNKNTSSFGFEYEIKNFKDNLKLQTILSINDIEIQNVTLNLKKEHGTFSLDARNQYEAFKVQMWSPNCPHIFDIEYVLYDGDVEIDRVNSYTAFKTFEARKNLFILNNNQYFLKGILFQGYYPNDGLTPNDEQIYIDMINKCKAIGLNNIRVHQKIEDELFYYYCDILGITTFLELPSPYEFTSRTKENLVRDVKEAVIQMQNHPSIIAYVPINESWGVPNITTNKIEQDFASSLYYLVKSLDHTRLVIDNDGWEHTENTDIVTLHNYDQNPETLKKLYEDVEGVVNDTLMSLEKQSRATYNVGCKYKGQPIMLDEFVGTMIEGSSGWGYGNSSSNKDDYFNRIKALISGIRHNPLIAGYCITQFNDTYQEKNGLFDENFEPKLPLNKFKEIIDE